MSKIKKASLGLVAGLSMLSLFAAPAYALSDSSYVRIIDPTPQPKPNLLSWFFTQRLYAGLSDDQEVPQSGDEDAFGSATVRLYPNQSKLCINMHIWNLNNPTAAHIHQAQKGTAGPVVVILPTPDSAGRADGCVEVDSEKIEEIRDNVGNYYVNVHSQKHPDGAIRGLLMQ